MKAYLITGRPGIGKSTLFNNIVMYLKKHGVKVGGIRSPEVRGSNGRRIGFKVIDLMTNEEAWLARRGYQSKIKVGAYGVLIEEASNLIEKALTRALMEAEVIGIDEIGPMELKIPVFRRLLYKILVSNKPKILVIHYRLCDRYILSKLSNSEKITVTLDNRGILNRELPIHILREIRDYRGRDNVVNPSMGEDYLRGQSKDNNTRPRII